MKIGDFGISKSLESSRQMAKTYCGTPVYMAPEILAGGHVVLLAIFAFYLPILFQESCMITKQIFGL